MEEWVKERIEENKELFTRQEIELMKNNIELCKKIYIMAIINTKEAQK